MIRALVCVLGLAVAGVLVWSAMHIFDKSTPEPQEQIDFQSFLDDEAALNVYTAACGGVLNQGYDMFDIDAQVPDSEARQSSVKRCLEHRNEQLLKWDKFIESAVSRDILARAFFYKGNLHYADAYDNRSIESAKLAVHSLESSLSYAPAFIEKGFSGFDYDRIELIEKARNLKDELEIEEDRKKRKEQASMSGVQEQSTGEEKSGEVDGIKVPIVEQGVKP